MLGLFDIEGARGYNGLEGSTLDAANITVRPHSLSAPFSVMHGGQLVSGLLLLLLNPQNCLTWRCCEADSCEADLANNSLMGSILYIAKSLVARTISISSIPAQIHSDYYTLSLQSSTFTYRSIRPFSGPFKITMKRFNTLLICFFRAILSLLGCSQAKKAQNQRTFRSRQLQHGQ